MHHVLCRFLLLHQMPTPTSHFCAGPTVLNGGPSGGLVPCRQRVLYPDSTEEADMCRCLHNFCTPSMSRDHVTLLRPFSMGPGCRAESGVSTGASKDSLLCFTACPATFRASRETWREVGGWLCFWGGLSVLFLLLFPLRDHKMSRLPEAGPGATSRLAAGLP